MASASKTGFPFTTPTGTKVPAATVGPPATKTGSKADVVMGDAVTGDDGKAFTKLHMIQVRETHSKKTSTYSIVMADQGRVG